MFLRPVPAPNSSRSLEDRPVRISTFLESAKHLTLYQATPSLGGTGDGHNYFLRMSGTRLTRNIVRTKCNTTWGPRSVYDLFFQIFQFSGDADLNVRHSHGYSSERSICPCFTCDLGLPERFKYEVCYPIILIIPLIPTSPPPLPSPPSLLSYLASITPVLVVADASGRSLWLRVSSSTWSGRDGFGLVTEIIGFGPNIFR